MLPLTKTPRRRLGTVETEQISCKRLPGSEGCKDTMKRTADPKKNFVRRDVVVCRTPRHIVYYYPKMPRVRVRKTSRGEIILSSYSNTYEEVKAGESIVSLMIRSFLPRRQ